MSTRRHRLSNPEIPEVILGLRLRLIQLLEEQKDADKAEVALHCLQRLLNDFPGRPKYPDFSWNYLDYYIYSGEEHILKRIEEMNKT